MGPVTPLIAVARALKREVPDADFIWFGTPTGPERALVEAEGMAFYPIHVAKFPRYPDKRWVTFPFDLARARREAADIIKREKPDAVISVGGFTAVPVIREAAREGIPCVIHQLDARMSWSNKAIERLCQIRTTSFARDGYELIPTPARFGMDDLPAKKSIRPTILIVGGGTGALALNEAVASKLEDWLALADVIHVTGRGKRGALADRKGYTVREMLDESGMKQALADADLVITRAGIGGLSDVSSCAKAAILVPIPGNQQVENAERFAQAEAAVVLDQVGDFADRLLASARGLLSDPERLRLLGDAARSFFHTDDGTALAERVLSVIKTR